MIQGPKNSKILKISYLYFLFYLIIGDSMMDNEIKSNFIDLSAFFRFTVCFVKKK